MSTEKTLTDVALGKIATRFVGSISHAHCIVNGEEHDLPIWRSYVEGNVIRVYIYFDDAYAGEISLAELLDVDGDVVCRKGEKVEKPADKGFYIAFKYRLVEEPVVSIEEEVGVGG